MLLRIERVHISVFIRQVQNCSSPIDCLFQAEQGFKEDLAHVQAGLLKSMATQWHLRLMCES